MDETGSECASIERHVLLSLKNCYLYKQIVIAKLSTNSSAILSPIIPILALRLIKSQTY